MDTNAPHPRWARATAEHVARVRRVLLGHIERTGRPLPGGVTADMVKDVRGLPTNDLLNLGQMMADHEDGMYLGLKAVLDDARTQTTTDDASA